MNEVQLRNVNRKFEKFIKNIYLCQFLKKGNFNKPTCVEN